MSEQLNKLRLAIDEQDRQIIAALGRRMELSEKIGEYKKQKGIPVYAPERESAVLERIRELAGERYAADMTRIYSLIIELSRIRQEKNSHE